MDVTRSLMFSLFLVQPCAGAFRAGTATIDVTPPTGYATWGYAARKDAPSEGVLDRLQARALVLEVAGSRLAIVSLDLGRAPTRTSTTRIREAIQKAGIQTLFLAASHTHHGPILELDNWPTPKTSYVRELEKKLIAVILQANKNLEPARHGLASATTQLNRNRHSKRADAPVDRELLVWRIENHAGKPLAHLVNFAAHPTMLPAKTMKFSADYVGKTCRIVEKTTRAPCLFLQGAAGDLSPNRSLGQTPEAFGQKLAEQVLTLAGKIRCASPTKERLVSSEESFRFKPRVDLSNPLWRLGLSAAFYPEFISFYEREYREGVRPSLTLALLNDRVGIVGVSGEFFCAHALHLKRRARLDHLVFIGYCNDYHQYFPTIEAVTEGGYGTEPYVGTAEVGAGERIMDRALIGLYRLRGQLK